jgi:NAD(P)-dependent dehydrogenase (short-subunit alcohol dehydrogenase family)
MRLRDKTALITGATRGMGRASARLFAKEGAVDFIAARNLDRGNALATEITGGGGREPSTGVPEVGPGALTSGYRWSVMIPVCRCGCST